MYEEFIHLNNPQLITVANDPKSEVDIWGRGTGKSFVIGWEINQINRTMPRAITSITGQTYGQLLTRTLPSTFKFLESLGYKRYDPKTGGNYVINQKPPEGWYKPYENVLDYRNFISFSNGNGYLMLSQERQGSARGPNVDRHIIDEALTINKQRYDQETNPTNRGNNEHFGEKSPKHITQHHGFRFVSSMPFMPEQKWLLDYAKYYEEEANIQIFDIWNQIVKLQLELISATKAGNKAMYSQIWNETVRLKAKIAPFTSKDGVLFTLANAFDNMQNLGMSYIINTYDTMANLTFMIEILNWIIDRVEDCYYSLETARHVYYDAYNDSFIRSYAENTDYDFNQLEKHDSRFDLDCDPQRPLEVAPDWGSKISLFTIAQERNYNFVNGLVEPVDCTINEFFVKPDQSPKVMIDHLVDQFCNYYQHHAHKHIVYFRDKYGDSRNPSAKNSKSYNEQAIERFRSKGWHVTQRTHKGMEPPQHEKYLLWANILKGGNPLFPKTIFNGKNCKYTLISMSNTSIREDAGKFKKNKNTEGYKSVLPEESTHFGDAVDKRIWTKYGQLLNRHTTFVDPRF